MKITAAGEVTHTTSAGMATAYLNATESATLHDGRNCLIVTPDSLILCEQLDLYEPHPTVLHKIVRALTKLKDQPQ